ncbi:hypothetical protein [Microcystis phage Mel-JY01]
MPLIDYDYDDLRKIVIDSKITLRQFDINIYGIRHYNTIGLCSDVANHIVWNLMLITGVFKTGTKSSLFNIFITQYEREKNTVEITVDIIYIIHDDGTESIKFYITSNGDISINTAHPAPGINLMQSIQNIIQNIV